MLKQLEGLQVDPSLLAYSIVLGKDPNNYQSYTPQHKIGKSQNMESGSLIKFYKTGQQEDGYNGYSSEYRDLNIDVYKTHRCIRHVRRMNSFSFLECTWSNRALLRILL